MKSGILTIFISMFVFQLLGQDVLTHKVSCVTGENSFSFCIQLRKADFVPYSESTYFWFDGKNLFQNKGGFSGSLLQGTFEKKTLAGNLVEKGEFNMGLKDGRWLTWDDQGKLSGETNWKKGRRTGKSWFLDSGTGEKTVLKYRNDLEQGRYFIYRNDSLVERGKYRKGKKLVPKSIFSFLRKKDKSQHPDESKEEQGQVGTLPD